MFAESRRDFLRTLLAGCAVSFPYKSVNGQSLPSDNGFQAGLSHLYTREGNQLRQILLLNVPTAAGGGTVEAMVGKRVEKAALSALRKIDNRYYLPITPVEQETKARLVLRNGLKSQEISFPVRPTRRWEVYLVHNSHEDPGFLDIPSVMRARFVPFIDEAMKYCQETDSWPEDSKFRWNIEVSYLVEDYLKARGKVKLQEVMEWIRNRRMTIGATYCNADTDFMSLETLHRTVYYATSHLENEFNITLEGAFIDDVNGFAWALVEVFAKSGVRYLVFGANGDRDNIHAANLPELFYLEGPEGSEILVWLSATYVEGFNLIPSYVDPYTGEHVKGLNIHEGESTIGRYFERYEQHAYPFDAILLQVASDFTPPFKSLSEVVRTWNSLWAYPHLRLSVIPEFFEYMEQHHKNRIPRLRGGVPDGWVNLHIGEANAAALARRTEVALPDAERLATLAQLVAGAPQRQKEFFDAYNELVLWEDHTIEWDNMRKHRADIYVPESEGGGKQHWEEKVAHVHFAHHTAERVEKESLDALCRNISIRKSPAFVVWNPLSWQRDEIVRTPLPKSFQRPFRLIDLESGNEISYQVNEGSLTFYAERVPPFGYRMFAVESGNPQNASIPPGGSDHELENQFYKINLRAKDGTLYALFDKELRREFVDRNAKYGFNALVYRVDHRINERTYETLGVLPVEQISIRRHAAGAVYSSLVVSGRVGYLLNFEHEIILYHTTKRIEFHNRMERRPAYTKESVFYAFPFAVPAEDHLYIDLIGHESTYKLDVPGAVMRPDIDQIPGSNRDSYVPQHWVSVARKDYGIFWSSADAPVVQLGGIQAEKRLMYLTLADDDELATGGLYSYLMSNHWTVDVPVAQGGDYLFRYAVSTHGPDWTYNQAHHFGWGFMSPLRTYVMEKSHSGSWSQPARSFLHIVPENVLLAGMKAAEDGDGIILRLYEGAGLETSATISLNLPAMSVAAAFNCDARERNLTTFESNGDLLSLTFNPWETRTVRLRFK